MKCLWHGALIAYSPMGSMARCLSAGRQGEGMMAMRIELEDVLFQLRQAEIELHIAISEEDDTEACNDLRKIIETLQDVILRIQLSA
jgi:hypothetical protein